MHTKKAFYFVEQLLGRKIVFTTFISKQTLFWMEYKLVISDICWNSSSGTYLISLLLLWIFRVSYLTLRIHFILDFLVSQFRSPKSFIFPCIQWVFSICELADFISLNSFSKNGMVDSAIPSSSLTIISQLNWIFSSHDRGISEYLNSYEEVYLNSRIQRSINDIICNTTKRPMHILDFRHILGLLRWTRWYRNKLE